MFDRQFKDPELNPATQIEASIINSLNACKSVSEIAEGIAQFVARQQRAEPTNA
jgi:hypothetical protein